MYFPIGWPKVLDLPELKHSPDIKQVKCNRDRILLAIITGDTVAVWFCKPCVPIVLYRRTPESLEKYGTNILVEWKPDSSMLVVATSEGHLIFYQLNVITNQKGLYIQTDSPQANLRRDSAELFIKEIIPPLNLTLHKEEFVWDGRITCVVCITLNELMVATSNGHILRYKWDGTQNRDYNLDLRRIPFCINQQVSKAVPIVEENTFVIAMEYSPLVGGFAIVFNDGRAAFLTATSLRFDPNQTQGIWAQGIEDATSTSVNHKFRLISFGRSNSECIVYYVDETTGGLAISHQCTLSSKDYPGYPGDVNLVTWTPDGCAMVVAWSRGGIAMWSTFGALLMCSLAWDYGLHVDLERNNPLHIACMEWGTEGYQLWMIRKNIGKKTETDDSNGNKSQINDDSSITTSLVQLDFVKSALTINPCMNHQSHLYLQGEDKLYINSADTLIKKNPDRLSKDESNYGENAPNSAMNNHTLSEGRQWLILPIPSTYTATNWPIRYSAIDSDGHHIAIAGRTGLAHYTMNTRRWKLFGNETQEKDFIVSGGLLWWGEYTVLGCYSIVDNNDEIRFYSRDCKLDNKFAKIVRVEAGILLMNSLQDQLITFGADGHVCVYNMKKNDNVGNVDLTKIQVIDISALCVHPACIVSLTLTSLKTETGRGQNANIESMVLNVSGRLLMVQRENRNGDRSQCLMPTVLASCVENVWVPSRRKADKVHLTEALWLFCGAHGMRVWLPLYPRDGDKSHSFMSKRIMLPFHLRIYPLAILFEDAIILGAENDTVLYTTDSNSPFSLPFSVLQRTSQVYLHQILRQLIRRNLGYHAWEIARSCTSLPYFPHSLELLLHEVLEEEATSKEPIPDAQLPSVIEFIMEFSVYLQTVVQCARKTEIALWPYLFSAAGKPKDLFQECMAKRQLDTAASYLIILQNLEASTVSRQYATLLLDTALDQSKWELAKDLVRFLRAIDPNDVESPRNSMILPNKLILSQTTPPVSPNAEDISLILGNVQRVRSYSTTVLPKVPADSATSKLTAAATGTNLNMVTESPVVVRRKKSVPVAPSTSITGTTPKNDQITDSAGNSTAEEFFIDVILQRHARRLLSAHRLTDLGYFAANLDFHLVVWLVRERERAARIDDFVRALRTLHEEFTWPYPTAMNLLTTTSNDNTHGLNGNVDLKLKSLHIDTDSAVHSPVSHVGDSGYMSFPGVPCGSGLVTSHNDTIDTAVSQLTDAETESQPAGSVTDATSTQLPPKPLLFNPTLPLSSTLPTHNTNTYSVADNFRLSETHIRSNLVTNRTTAAMDDDMSVVSSLWLAGEERELPGGSLVPPGGGSENWEVPSTQILEQLSNAGNKGSHRAEVQLRYLLQIFMEASCLEWSILISVLLRDALAVVRTVNAAKSLDQSIESVSRLKQGLQILHYWTNTECLGYQAFMLAIQNQISVLSTILATKIQHQQILDHQRAVSATLSKVAPHNTPNTSLNHINTSQLTAHNQSNLNSATSVTSAASVHDGDKSRTRLLSTASSGGHLANNEKVTNSSLGGGGGGSSVGTIDGATIMRDVGSSGEKYSDEREESEVADSSGCVLS